MRLKTILFVPILVSFLAAFISFQLWQANAQSSLSINETISEKPPLTESVFLKGETLYQKQCAVCHGSSGAGDGKAAYLLSPKPRNFTRNEFRLVSTSTMEATDEDLFKTITRGMPGSAMPSWKSLSQEDRWALIYYVRYLANLGKKQENGELTEEQLKAGLSWETQKNLASNVIDPESIIRPPQEIPPTPEKIATGKALFAKACTSCHGPLGKGDGKMKMADSLGYPLRPRDLTAGIFKGYFDYENLYYRIAAGLPGSPMPGYKDALTPDQIQDLIHYLQTIPDWEAEKRNRVEKHQIIAVKTTEPLELDPLSKNWLSLKSVYIALTPLWWRDKRIEGVEVRALHNENEMAIQLSWKDSSQNNSTLTPQAFSDGAAVQISTEKDPPFFGMGSKDSPVTLWHWKSAWQQDVENREDVETHYPDMAVNYYAGQTDYQKGAPFEPKNFKAKFHDPLFLTGYAAGNRLSDPNRDTAAEEAQAEGFGTLTRNASNPHEVKVRGVYENGVWSLVFIGKLGAFKIGEPISIAFAVWDGDQRDRNGQKMVSIWNELVLEP